jgi:hypothetical protein
MPHDLPTKLNYYNDASDPSPYQHVGMSFEATITDITGREDQFTLDNDGFLLTRQVTKVTDFLDEQNVKTHYYPELVELMKKVCVSNQLSPGLIV